MQPFPYVPVPFEPTIKQVWLASFTALMGHMSPAEAAKAADEALLLAHNRWENPVKVQTWDWTHNHPIGYTFGLELKSSVLPDTGRGAASSTLRGLDDAA